MKFQNPILNFKWTDGRKNRRKDEPKAICPLNFFKVTVGGIKTKYFPQLYKALD